MGLTKEFEPILDVPEDRSVLVAAEGASPTS